MYKISTHIELPIAHTLDGAYSGLCCGNVYRDKKNDSEQDRYDLNGSVLPILHGHNYFVTITLQCKDVINNNMVIDFKEMKKIIKDYFDQFDHAMILKKGNPLIDVYKKNYETHGIDFDRSRLFVWDENPTAEYMAKYWTQAMNKAFRTHWPEWNGCDFDISIIVEETSHNKVEYDM